MWITPKNQKKTTDCRSEQSVICRVVKIILSVSRILANMLNNNSIMSLRWSTVFGISIFLFSAAAQVKVGRAVSPKEFNVSAELCGLYFRPNVCMHDCDVFFNCFIKAQWYFVSASPTPTILFAHDRSRGCKCVHELFCHRTTIHRSSVIQYI